MLLCRLPGLHVYSHLSLALQPMPRAVAYKAGCISGQGLVFAPFFSASALWIDNQLQYRRNQPGPQPKTKCRSQIQVTAMHRTAITCTTPALPPPTHSITNGATPPSETLCILHSRSVQTHTITNTKTSMNSRKPLNVYY